MIMYRRSRFHRINSGVFWLCETPDIPDSARWDTRKPRKTIWIRLQDKETGREFSFYYTHMDNKGVEARINGAIVNVARVVSTLSAGATSTTSFSDISFSNTSLQPMTKNIVNKDIPVIILTTLIFMIY